jgi:uncharacterized protein YdeI (YjbR/CyaY-like superfamily)
VTKPRFFRNQQALRAWLGKHHADENELLVGFHRKDSGRPSITYPEALDEALCFGWIDGIRRGLNTDSYTVRFTPRRPRSNWSQVNIRHVKRLTAAGRMKPPGLKAFNERVKSRDYSFESSIRELDRALGRRFRANRKAWGFFQTQPPGYRRVSQFWVMSAKQEATRVKRLAVLITCSARAERIPLLSRPAGKA